MDNLYVGVYVNRASPIHRLNEKFKIFIACAMIVFTLVSCNFVMYAVDFAAVIVCSLIARLKLREIFSFFKRLWLFLLAIILMNTLFFGGENIWFSFKMINISEEGLIQGLTIVWNVTLIVLWSNLLLAVTSPLELMSAVRFYLSPLKFFKIPVDVPVLIISVAIQFVPILFEEVSNIKKAQIARGAEFESKNLLKKAKSILPLIVPVFVSAFKRADELAAALEARGYRRNEND